MDKEDELGASTSSIVRLTVQQRLALERGPVSVALSAGAGCGKTTVLTERFLQELEGPQARPLNSLLALTFTEKAARELRQRIRLSCRERIASGTEPEIHQWRMTLRGLEAAPIGTFHEFCARMLRVHAIESGIDPEFTVLDESIGQALRDQAVNTTLSRAVSDQDLDIIDLAVDYGLGQIRDALGDILGSASLEELRNWDAMDQEETLACWNEVWVREGRSSLIRQAAHSARECRETLETLEPNSVKLRNRRAEILQLICDLDGGNPTFDQLSELKNLARISDLRGKDLWPSEECKKQVQKRFESLRKALEKILPRLTWNEKQTREEIVNRQRLIRLAIKARSAYERLKSERNGLDFDDLQTRFVDLIREHPELLVKSPSSPELGEASFEFILVDEFQDTDRLQSEILRRMGHTDFLRGRLFVVGDYRQSIYGFRGADPSIFQEWRQAFPPLGRRELSENFRSVPGIVHFVNALFADSFGPEKESTGEDSSLSLSRLVPMRDAVSSEPAVEFHWAEIAQSRSALEDESKAPPTTERASVKELRRAEAKSLARHIRQRLEKGWTIQDRKTKLSRLAGPGDVALLFRAMSDVGVYESAFAEEGLDYHTIGGGAFFAQQEIDDIINVLSVIEDPLDEISLAGALRSPFFGLTDNGLYWLATSFPEGLSVGLARADQIANLPSDDQARAVRARGLLETWHGLKDRVTIADLVSRVLTESGYEAALVCEFMGPRKLANTRKLVTMAREFDRQSGFLLADFVAQIRAHRDDPPREEQASTSDEEGSSIRLMSIHRSKGLEFPIVVVPDLNRANDQRNRLIAISRELGLVVRPPLSGSGNEVPDSDDETQGGSLGWEGYRTLSRERDDDESLRIFYVAATRARDSLILSSGISLSKGVRSTALRLLQERFDLASGTLLASLPTDWPAPTIRVVSLEPELDGLHESTQPLDPVNRRRLSLNEIREICSDTLRLIDTKPIASDPRSQPMISASLIDLDQLDGLSVRSRRIHSLLRLTLADPLFWKGIAIQTLVERHGMKQTPAANSSILQEVERLLENWIESEAFSRIRGNLHEIAKPGFTWSVNRPVEEGRATLFRGSCDLLLLDAQFGWMPLVVSLDRNSSGSEGHRLASRLRLLFSVFLSASTDLGKMRAGWILELKESGEPSLRLEERIDDRSLDQAVQMTLTGFADQLD